MTDLNVADEDIVNLDEFSKQLEKTHEKISTFKNSDTAVIDAFKFSLKERGLEIMEFYDKVDD